jgi:hypothetical protein
VTDSSFDAEIDACIPSAEGLVDGFLKAYDLSVPAEVPQLVRDAAAHFAAWLFRRRREPAEAEVFWNEARRFIDAYVDAEAEAYVGSV